MIRRLVNQHRDWVIPEGRKVGSEKTRLLHRHRYGISACGVEAFGIAVAEQVKAGCIPFVPDSGGQTEIVGDPALCYADPDDAVAKIDAVLRDEAKQHALREHLRRQAEQFSAERFMQEFRGVVERFQQQQASLSATRTR
jgi:glycosyltransferase involved in cell wall biosynthesis